MECRMRARVKSMVDALTREHQQELAAAGTLVERDRLKRLLFSQIDVDRLRGKRCGLP
jgi:hypothetical protein